MVRILIGIGLFMLGFQLGRQVGRMEPIADEIRGGRRRKGIIIEGQKETVDPATSGD